MTSDKKITKKDNYNTLYELVSNAGLDKETEDRLHAFIDRELELMAQRAEKSKKYQKEHNASTDEMSDMIWKIIADADAPVTVSDIVPKVVDATPQKVVYRLGQLYKDGKINKETKNIKTEDITRKVTYYSAIAAE